MSITANPIPDIGAAEHTFWLARQVLDADATATMTAGMRAARAKDPGLMAVLERMTELLCKTADSQYGETQRAKGGSMNVPPAQAVVWKNAYEHALRGDPVTVYAAMYGAAAIKAGLTPTPYRLFARG